MALFDHRVFRFKDEWWAAQVHSASGAGYSNSPQLTSERVFFSSLTNRERNTVTGRIPVGWLNKLTYRALTRRLETGDDYGSHFKMSAFNAPSAEELGAPDLTDAEGLRWVIRPVRSVRATTVGSDLVEAAEFVCLDDSALRKDVVMGEGSIDQLKANTVLATGVVDQIKGTYEDFDPPQFDAA